MKIKFMVFILSFVFVICAFGQGQINVTGLPTGTITTPNVFWEFGYSDSPAPSAGNVIVAQTGSYTSSVNITPSSNSTQQYEFFVLGSETFNPQTHVPTGIAYNYSEAVVAPANSALTASWNSGSGFTVVPEPSTNSFFFLSALTLLLFTRPFKIIGFRLLAGLLLLSLFLRPYLGFFERFVLTEQRKAPKTPEQPSDGPCMNKGGGMVE